MRQGPPTEQEIQQMKGNVLKTLVESFVGTTGAKVNVFNSTEGVVAEYYEIDGQFLMDKTYTEMTLPNVCQDAREWVENRGVLNG